jgi:hypothetical protein
LIRKIRFISELRNQGKTGWLRGIKRFRVPGSGFRVSGSGFPALIFIRVKF